METVMADMLYENTGIKQKVIEEIRAMAKAYNVEKIVLFGSRARGDYKERSDIDLAVYGGKTAQFALMADEETSTLLKYDIVDMNSSLEQELRKSIEGEGKIIYEKV